MDKLKLPIYFTLKRSKHSRYNSWSSLHHMTKDHRHLALSDKSKFCKFCGCIFKENKQEYIETFSIRPTYMSYIPEIEPNDIYLQIRHNITNIKLSQVVTKDKYFPAIREKIIKKIRLFLFNSGYQLSLISSVVFYLDYICNKCSFTSENKVEKSAIAAIMLALKYNDNEVNYSSVKDIIKNFKTNNFFLSAQIANFEVFCLKNIFHYELNNSQMLIPIINMFLENGILFTFDRNENRKVNLKLYDKVLSLGKQIMEQSIDYLNFDPIYLCCAIIAHYRQNYDYEEWPKIFEEVYGISLSDFKRESIFVNKFVKTNILHLNMNVLKKKQMVYQPAMTSRKKGGGQKNMSMSVEVTRDNSGSVRRSVYSSMIKQKNTSTEKKKNINLTLNFSLKKTIKKNKVFSSFLNKSLEHYPKEFEEFKKKLFVKNCMTSTNKNQKTKRESGFYKTINIHPIKKFVKKMTLPKN